MSDFITDDWSYNSMDSFLSKLVDSLPEIEQRLEEQAEDANEYELENAVLMAANIFAVGFIADNYMDLVKYEVLRACANSGEYNYDLYVYHLLSALELNRDNIVRIHHTGSFSVPEILVDFSPLGGIEQWVDAAMLARGRLNMGKLHDTDIGVASEKWRRYIYTVDREGMPATRKKKVKDSEGNTTTEDVDITDKYRGKYRETIQARLSTLSADKAPFWYLIEYGNTGRIMEGEGTPYPIVQPQNMQNNIEAQLRMGFNDTFSRYREIAERVIRGRERGRGVPPIEEPIDWVPKTIQQIVDEAIAELPPYDPSMGTRTVTTVRDTENTFYEIYYKRGGIVNVRMADAVHHYMGKPWWWE